jgi:hypothetical protein
MPVLRHTKETSAGSKKKPLPSRGRRWPFNLQRRSSTPLLVPSPVLGPFRIFRWARATSAHGGDRKWSSRHKRSCAKQLISPALSTRVALSSPSDENILISRFRKLWFDLRVPSHRGGASRSSRTSGAGCGGRVGSQHGLHADERSRCDGEVAWFWHPGADAPRNAVYALSRTR